MYKIIGVLFYTFIFIGFGALTSVHAQVESDLLLSPVGDTPRNMIYTVTPATTVQGTLKIGNTATVAQDVIITAESDDGEKPTKPFDTLRFFGAPPADFLEGFEDVQQDISTLCKERDKSAELDTWCDGQSEVSLSVAAEGEETFYYTMTFSGEDNTKANIVVTTGEEDDQRRLEQVISYVPQIKKVYLGGINQLKLVRAFDLWDLGAWARAGFHEAYDAEVEIINLSTQELPYTVKLFVRNGDNETSTENSGTLEEDESLTEMFDTVKMPRFGTVYVYAQMLYDTPQGQQIAVTEEAPIVITPIREILAVIFGITLLGVLWYAMRKFMGRNRNDDDDYYDEDDDELEEDEQESDGEDHDEEKEVLTREPDEKDTIAVKAISAEEEGVQDDHDVPLAYKSAEATSKAIAVTVDEEDQAKEDQDVSTAAQKSSENKIAADKEIDEEDKSEDEKAADTGSAVVASRSADEQGGLDIDWIKEDDDVFADAMRTQERKANFHVGIFALLFLGVIAFLAFLAFGRNFFADPEVKEVSIAEVDTVEEMKQDSIADIETESADENAEDGGVQDDSDATEDGVADEEVIEEESEDDNEETEEEKVDPASVTVKVLNGTTVAGAAGRLNDVLSDKEYDTQTPANANNTYTETTIYYSSESGSEAQAESVKEAIAVLYDATVVEESDAVTSQYGVDVVVVIGG